MMPEVGKSGPGTIAGEVVRRHVGRHADRDAGRAIDQQVRHPRRHDLGFVFLLVVVGLEVDGVLVEIGQYFGREAIQSALGVTHCGGAIAIDRAEVALAINQRIAQRETLRHADQRVVDRLVAMRMVFTDHVTDHAGALDVRAVPDVVELLHREQHAAMNRLQAVADVGQGAPDDHAHGVVEVALADFVLDVDANDFFGLISHARSLP